MNKLIWVGIALALTGCASAGVKIDEAQLTQLHPGTTTYQEVIAKLGQPTGSTLSSDGNRTVSYVYTSYQTRPETFIPYVGAFVGGADSRSSSVTLTFGPDSILRTYSQGNTQLGVGTGFEAGSTGGAVPAQPRQ